MNYEANFYLGKNVDRPSGKGVKPAKSLCNEGHSPGCFNYKLKETVTARGQTASSPNEINEIATIVFKKSGRDWQALTIHVAVKGAVFTPH